MSREQMHALKAALLEVYGSFADKRIKNIDTGNRFIVDERTRNDIAADGNVYGWFCSLFLDIEQHDRVALTVINVPTNRPVADWLARNAEPFGRDGFRVSIDKGAQDKLGELAKLVQAITARGKRYDVPHYKYAVPRVVQSLEQLENGLDLGWAT